MKKLVTILMTLVLSISLAACGGSSGTISSVKDLQEKMNMAVAKVEGVEIKDEAFAVKDDIGEYTFTVDGIECVLRLANVEQKKDISGIKTDDGKTLYEDAEEINTHYIENDTLNAVRWFTVDGQYIFVMKSGEVEWDKFDGLSKQFIDIKPVNWPSDISYEDYKAAESYYVSDKGEMAAINIQLDKLSVIAYGQLDDGTVVSWEALADLDGDTLSFDKATVSSSKYDEESGESTVTDLGEEGAGTIKIVDGNLDFSNVTSEYIKGKKFQPFVME